jgi:hypothetical protein
VYGNSNLQRIGTLEKVHFRLIPLPLKRAIATLYIMLHGFSQNQARNFSLFLQMAKHYGGISESLVSQQKP